MVIGDVLGSCFQLQLMLGLWIPVVWLVSFHCVLEPPWIDSARDREEQEQDDSEKEGEDDSNVGQLVRQHTSGRPVTEKLSAKERFCFILTLWPYMIPLFLVYCAEYIIQAGFWDAMGFPVTDRYSRVSFYKTSNLIYQVGVFVSRSTFAWICINRLILWLGPTLQLLMLVFFWRAAVTPFGGWWLYVPCFFVGLLGGGVYVGGFTLLSQEIDPEWVELGLTSASLADTLGIILATILSIIVQGCVFGQMNVTDTKPDFTCGYTIWDNITVNATNATCAKVCFPGVCG